MQSESLKHVAKWDWFRWTFVQDGCFVYEDFLFQMFFFELSGKEDLLLVAIVIVWKLPSIMKTVLFLFIYKKTSVDKRESQKCPLT